MKTKSKSLWFYVSIKWEFYFRDVYNINLCWVCVGSTTTSESLDNIGETSVELDTSLCAAGLLLSLFLLFNFWCLSLDLTSTSQRSVHFTTKQWDVHVQLNASQRWNLALIWQDHSFTREGEVGVDYIFKDCQFSL